MDRLLFGTRSIGRASSGLPPRTPTKRLRLLELRQGQWPLEPVNGFVLRGGPTRTLRGRGRPSPENKPQLIDCKGPRPLLGIQGAKPLGGVRGKAPAPAWFKRFPLIADNRPRRAAADQRRVGIAAWRAARDDLAHDKGV